MRLKSKLRGVGVALGAAAMIFAGNAGVQASRGQWLEDGAIRGALGGKTIEGRYASGKHFTERYLANGRLEYLEGGNTMSGYWSVTAGTLCTIYDFDPSGGCYRVTRVGANCFEFYFASRTEVTAPGPEGSEPKWTARGSVSGEKVACGDDANV